MQAITENTSELWIAKHQICDLQKRYAIATDLLTTNTAENITAATATYQQIFTPNAEIHAAGVDTQIGPEAWGSTGAQRAGLIYRYTAFYRHTIGKRL